MLEWLTDTCCGSTRCGGGGVRRTYKHRLWIYQEWWDGGGGGVKANIQLWIYQGVVGGCGRYMRTYIQVGDLPGEVWEGWSKLHTGWEWWDGGGDVRTYMIQVGYLYFECINVLMVKERCEWVNIIMMIGSYWEVNWAEHDKRHQLSTMIHHDVLRY